MARDIKDLVRVDDHTVRIELNHRDPRWFFTFLTVRFTEGLFILPKHIYAATDPNDLAGFTAMKSARNGPVGTGAFKITSMTPERIILDRRDDWWGLKTGFHPPAGDEACDLRALHHARGRPPSSSPTTGRHHPRSACAGDEEPAARAIPKKITTFSGNKSPYGNIDWWQTSLLFNHAQKQFQDVRIRRAVSLYLNRKQAVDYAYQGAAEISGLTYPRYPRLEVYFSDMDRYHQEAPHPRLRYQGGRCTDDGGGRGERRLRALDLGGAADRRRSLLSRSRSTRSRR